MVCSNCGTSVDDSLEFCPNCSVRNDNYKNPFIFSNTDIGNIASSDSFATASADSTQIGDAPKTDENASIEDTETSKSEEGNSSNMDSTESNLNNESNSNNSTLPPIENISTSSSEVFKSEESSPNLSNNNIPSGSGEVFRSEDAPVEKTKLSKKNKFLIIGGVVVLVIILFLLFILNTIFAKSPEYVVAQMLKSEASIKSSHIKYNLNINGSYKYANSKYSTTFSLQGSLNIQNGSGGVVKYDGINSVLGSIKSPYSGVNFNIDVSSRSEYYKNKVYFEFTKFQPQLFSSLLKLHLNSWEETSIQKQQAKKLLNFKLPNLKNVKVTEIGNTTINSVPVTEYSVLLNSKMIKNALPSELTAGGFKLNKNIKLYLWINTSTYYLYKLAVSTNTNGENINFNMNFSNINKLFNILIPSSYTKY